MGRYEIHVRHSVYKDLEAIPKRDVQRILAAIRGLAGNPRPAQSLKMSGAEKYRLRCGSYRVLYEIRDDALIVYVVRVAHRKDVYRN